MRKILLRIIPGFLLATCLLLSTTSIALADNPPAGGATGGLGSKGQAEGAGVGSAGEANPGSSAGRVSPGGSPGQAVLGGSVRQVLPASGRVVPASGPQVQQGPPPLTSERFSTDQGHVGGSNLCYGPTCDNQDPAAMKCNLGKMDIYPFTILDANRNVVAIGYNIYSYACNANWAEGRLDPVGANTPQGHNIVISIWTRDRQGNIHSTCFPSNDNGATCDTNGYNGATGWPAFSNMVDGSLPTQAGVQAVGRDGMTYYGYNQE